MTAVPLQFRNGSSGIDAAAAATDRDQTGTTTQDLSDVARGWGKVQIADSELLGFTDAPGGTSVWQGLPARSVIMAVALGGPPCWFPVLRELDFVAIRG